MIELHTLFEKPHSTKRPSLRKELGNVKSGKKAISMFLFPREYLRTEAYLNLRNICLELDLSVVESPQLHDAECNVDEVRVFVARENELWRVPAFNLTRMALHRFSWSDGAEYLESRLLGYDDVQSIEWILKKKRGRVDWSGQTIYFTLSENERMRSAYFGMKCIDPDLALSGLKLYFSRSSAPIRDSAYACGAKSTVSICRSSISMDAIFALFGTPERWGSADVISTCLAGAMIQKFNTVLDVRIDVLTDAGWK